MNLLVIEDDRKLNRMLCEMPKLLLLPLTIPCLRKA